MDQSLYLPPEVNVEPLGDLMLDFLINHDIEESYLATSAFRFLDKTDETSVKGIYRRLTSKDAGNIVLPEALQTRLVS